MVKSAQGYDAGLRASTAGLILAGGQGSRMQDADKGLVLLGGEPMVAHVARRLAPQVATLIISANRNVERYADYGRVVSDDVGLGAWQGPLAGVAAGLATWSGEWLVTSPCDTPFLPEDLACRLIEAAQEKNAPLATARVQNQRHSVCMALRTDLLPDLQDYLQGGDRKVELWQRRVGGIEVHFDDTPDAFMNVNTPEELSQAQGYDSQWRRS